jgi:hypothetical protein
MRDRKAHYSQWRKIFENLAISVADTNHVCIELVFCQAVAQAAIAAAIF